MDRLLRMPGDHCMWCVEPANEPCQLGCRKPTMQGDDHEAVLADVPREYPDLSHPDEPYVRLADVMAALSRCPPPERDTERLRTLGDEMAAAILDVETHDGRLSWNRLVAARSAWLAEFSPVSNTTKGGPDA